MSPGRVEAAVPVIVWNTAPERPERSASYDDVRLLHADALDYPGVQGLIMADALFDSELGNLSSGPVSAARHGSFRSCAPATARRGCNGSLVELSAEVCVEKIVDRTDRREREPNVGPGLGGRTCESLCQSLAQTSSQPRHTYLNSKERNGRAQPLMARRFSSSNLGLDERPAPVRRSRSFGGSWSSE